MKLAEQSYTFTLLTPAMIGGALGKEAEAEMRIPSVRGHIRWWHRKAALKANCNSIWGQTEPSVIASRVSLALEAGKRPSQRSETILPHKGGANRKALNAGLEFTLTLRRLVGCTNDQWKTAQKAVKLWLLLGGLGLRVNRAAGSVWPLDSWAPNDEAEFRRLLNDLGYKHPVKLAEASLGRNAQELRKAASDTVSVARYFGGIQPRRPSPLKIKVVRLGSSDRLLLTGLDERMMDEARSHLGSKDLGSAEWISV